MFAEERRRAADVRADGVWLRLKSGQRKICRRCGEWRAEVFGRSLEGGGCEVWGGKVQSLAERSGGARNGAEKVRAECEEKAKVKRRGAALGSGAAAGGGALEKRRNIIYNRVRSRCSPNVDKSGRKMLEIRINLLNFKGH